MTTSTNLNLAHSDGALSSPNQQLSLPTGPVGLVRPRRERTDEDRDFMARAFAVRAGGLAATAVYRCLAYHCSKSERRLAYPAQATVAEYCEIGVRHVRRVLRKLESDGLIVCEVRKKGAHPSHYSLTDEAPSGYESRLEADMRAANKEREGSDLQTRTSLSAVSKSLDPVKPEGPKQEVLPTVFPSPKQEKEPLPMAQEPAFKNPAQVGMLYSVARKLDYSLSDAEALRFDAMEHAGKKALLDRLLAEEQDKALHGEVAPPPKKPRAPRDGIAVERKPKPERPPCVEHRWSEPAEDGISNCANCDAEKTNE